MRLPDGSIEVRVCYETGFLRDLLARPLRRGMRCDGCQHWQPDPEWLGEGECDAQDEREYTSDYMACVHWSPKLGSDLDYMGVPLASPAAQLD
jgi:hypothetical protein